MKKFELFPTPVWHIDGASQSLVDVLYDGAYKCRDSIECVNQSNEEGYHSPYFEWNQFHPEGIEYIESILLQVTKEKCKVVNWWYNINTKGAWNIPHVHIGYDLALVFYLTDSDNKLSLVDPFPNRRITYNQHYQNYDSKKGDIIIFPSDIVHFVRSNDKEEDRICISMNIKIL